MKLTTRQTDALGHIADHCRKAAELATELSSGGSGMDWRTRYALEKCIEIIGEAATRLGKEFQTAHPVFPWHQIVGMRNRLIHGYDDVSNVLVWQTITEDLPTLLTHVENILARQQGTGPL